MGQLCRWWSKHEYLRKIFGTFEDGSNGVFCDVIEVLYCVSTSEKLSVKARFDARIMLDNMIRYQHVLTAITYLRTMEITFALLKYLQTSGLDFINAFNVVEATKKHIQQIYRDFATVVTKTGHLVQHANEVLEERECDFLIESSFPSKRFRKNKNEPLDECLSDSMKKFEVGVHNRILDQVVQSLHRRFATHKKFYVDLSYFDPKDFSETVLHTVFFICFKRFSETVLKHSPVQQDLWKSLWISHQNCRNQKRSYQSTARNWMKQVIIFLILLLINYLQVNVLTFYLTV